MFNYSFLTPQQIVFGWGRRSELGALAAGLGKRAFLISGSRTVEASGFVAQAEESLHQAGLHCETISVTSREPEICDVDSLVETLLAKSPCRDDIVVALGGGSTMDLAKAAAALVTNRQGSSIVDFLEGVGSGLQVQEQPLNLIAMPTTAGTGAEATKNAVISSNSDGNGSGAKFKKSLRSELMLPRIVLVDPEFTVSLKEENTSYTGMDTITQLIESYISRRSAPIPQALCLQGLKLAIPGLSLAVANPDLREARVAMSHAALLSGMALANSGLGLAHGVAAALGVHCGVAHGLACAVMLPVALQVNREVSRPRLLELERHLDPDGNDADMDPVDHFVFRIERLCRELFIPSQLRDLGVREDQLDDLVTGSRGNSMSGNPRELSDPELREVLEKIW